MAETEPTTPSTSDRKCVQVDNVWGYRLQKCVPKYHVRSAEEARGCGYGAACSHHVPLYAAPSPVAPLVHATSSAPFVAVCGSEEPGQKTTTVAAHVTCLECGPSPVTETPSQDAGGVASDLLPCPFCGGKARTVGNVESGQWWREVACTGCSARAGYRGDTDARAIVAWNRRATPPESVPVAWKVGDEAITPSGVRVELLDKTEGIWRVSYGGGHMAAYVAERELRPIPESVPVAPYVDVVFDGPPSHESGRFVECEYPAGVGVRVGEWINRGDGYWALRIPRVYAPPPSPAPSQVEREGCPDAALPDGPVCPKCGGPRAPSGVGGGSWVHFPRTPAPAQPTAPCANCGHSFSCHDGHTVRAGDSPRHHCSQGDGCKKYVWLAPTAPEPGPKVLRQWKGPRDGESVTVTRTPSPESATVARTEELSGERERERALDLARRVEDAIARGGILKPFYIEVSKYLRAYAQQSAAIAEHERVAKIRDENFAAMMDNAAQADQTIAAQAKEIERLSSDGAIQYILDRATAQLRAQVAELTANLRSSEALNKELVHANVQKNVALAAAESRNAELIAGRNEAVGRRDRTIEQLTAALQSVKERLTAIVRDPQESASLHKRSVGQAMGRCALAEELLPIIDGALAGTKEPR